MELLINVFDLDNCISDDKWRQSFIDNSFPPGNARFETYHSFCHLDQFRNFEETFLKIDQRLPFVIFTARTERHIKMTKWWCKRYLPFQPLKIFMRGNNDERCSVVVKKNMLQELVREFHCTVDYAFDDREDILQMYKENGVLRPTMVSIHKNEEKYQ